jgi:hypothetical protein
MDSGWRISAQSLTHFWRRVFDDVAAMTYLTYS